MVSLTGAEAAQPYVTEINKLQAAFDQLAAAITGGGTIWKIVIDAYIGGPSTTITVLDNFSGGDSTAILNDIKNVIGNKINIQTNALGAIT